MSFFIKLDRKPDTWEERPTLFIGYLISDKKFCSQSIKSYVSAIRGALLEDGVMLNEDKFLLTALMRACKLKNDKVRTRLPMNRGMVNVVVNKTIDHFQDLNQDYLTTLYSTIFATAYFGMFRVAELASGDHPVKVKDIQIADNKEKLMFILRTSKTHNFGNKPQKIKISSTKLKGKQQPNNRPTTFCPYKMLRTYLTKRPKYLDKGEPFFVFRDRSLIKPIHVRNTLKKMLNLCGFDQRFYNTHSLRAGRSVDLLKLGVKVSSIHIFGRWRSNAVFTYLTQ